MRLVICVFIISAGLASGCFSAGSDFNSDIDAGTVDDEVAFSHPAGTFVTPFELELTSDVQGAEIYYTLDGSTPGDEPGEDTLYTGPIEIDETSWVRARLFTAEAAVGPITSRAYIALEPALASFESNLPLIIIDTFGYDIDEEWEEYPRPYRPVLSVFIDGDESSLTSILDSAQHAGYGGMHVRGQSTAEYDKKQYKFETWDEADQDIEVSLLGFPEESDWVIHGPYSDKTLMRNFLMYTWSNLIGRYAVRTRFAELFMAQGGKRIEADDYRGVYVFMEKIKRDKDRVNVEKLGPDDDSEPEIKGGYILKRDWWEEEEPETWFQTEQYADVLMFEYPKPDRITDEQRDWIAGYVNAFENALKGPDFADPEEGYEKYIDVGSFIDHHILVELARNVDGFVLSTYMFKPREGKLTMGPIWDYNGALGNADYFEAWKPEGWHHLNPEFPEDNPNGYRWYERLFEDPGFGQRYAARWAELRSGELATAKLTDKIDHNAETLAEAVGRNFERWDILGEYIWPNDPAAEDRQSYKEEIDYLKNWLGTRLEWIDLAVLEFDQ